MNSIRISTRIGVTGDISFVITFGDTGTYIIQFQSSAYGFSGIQHIWLPILFHKQIDSDIIHLKNNIIIYHLDIQQITSRRMKMKSQIEQIIYKI